MMDQRVYAMEGFLADGTFLVSPSSLQPLKTELCVFSDSTKAHCQVAVPMSFGLLSRKDGR